MLFALTRRHCLRTVPAGDPSAFMAGGAWGSLDPPVIAICLPACSHAPSATRIRAVALPPWIRGNRDEPTSTPCSLPHQQQRQR